MNKVKIENVDILISFDSLINKENKIKKIIIKSKKTQFQVY